MKKGLRRGEVRDNGNTLASENSPDEEGIKTVGDVTIRLFDLFGEQP